MNPFHPLFCGILFLMVAGMVPVGAQDLKVLQNLNLESIFQNAFVDSASNNVPPGSPSTVLTSNSLADYNLRFLMNQTTTQISVEGQMNPMGEYDAKVLQAFSKVPLADGWSLSFGKKIVKWQDGQFKNPSDMVNSVLLYGQHGAVEGRNLVEVLGSVPVNEDLNIDLSGLATVDPANNQIYQVPFFLSAGAIFYPVEIRLKGGFQNGQVPQAGVAVKGSFSDIQWYSDNLFFTKSDITALTRPDAPNFKTAVGGSEVIPLVPGTVDSLTVMAEYDYRSDGLTKDEGTGFFGSRQSLTSDKAFRYYDEFRQYAFVKAQLTNLFGSQVNWAETASLNVEDGSCSIDSRIELSLKTIFTVGLTETSRLGSASSEVSGIGNRQLLALDMKASY